MKRAVLLLIAVALVGCQRVGESRTVTWQDPRAEQFPLIEYETPHAWCYQRYTFTNSALSCIQKAAP